jgi:hypothetical protein
MEKEMEELLGGGKVLQRTLSKKQEKINATERKILQGQLPVYSESGLRNP